METFNLQPSLPRVRAIAFYLPQFHPIPENDEWWGKGFTEWINVAKARPNFKGHEQPHIPADLGFYDLRVRETRLEQAELARRAGIHGFCFYYYWFAGKRLLYRPLEEILQSGEPDFPFCICWANENWTRAWDGRSGEVLIGQHHSEDDNRNFIQSLFPFFLDRRYIHVNGRPLLLIYRIDIIPDVHRAVEIWRNECAMAGINDPYLVAVQSFGIGDPTPYGFDAAVEFPPHGTDFDWNCNEKYRDRMLNPNFRGHIVDIERVIDIANQRELPPYRLFRGVMPRWDNTARRQDTSLIFVNSSPQALRDPGSHGPSNRLANTCTAMNDWCSSTPGMNGPRVVTSNPINSMVTPISRRRIARFAGKTRLPRWPYRQPSKASAPWGSRPRRKIWNPCQTNQNWSSPPPTCRPW